MEARPSSSSSQACAQCPCWVTLASLYPALRPMATASSQCDYSWGAGRGYYWGPVSLSTAFPEGRQLKGLCFIYCWTPRPRPRPATLQGLNQQVLNEHLNICMYVHCAHHLLISTACLAARLSPPSVSLLRTVRGARAQPGTGSLMGPVAAESLSWAVQANPQGGPASFQELQ